MSTRRRWLLGALSALAPTALAPGWARGDVTTLVGRPAPAVRARPLDDDRELSLEGHRGRVVLLAFVATWCSACRRMAPTLETLHEAHGGARFALLALSHEPRGRLRRHVAATQPGYPWLQCTGRTAVSYRADALPTLALIDARGVVRGAWQGARPSVAQSLRREVSASIGG